MTSRGSVFGPAEFGEGLGDARQGEADDVEVVAFDAGDVAARAALDGVGASFVVRLLGGEVAGDFFIGELGEMDEGGFDETAALRIWKAYKRHAGEDRVGAAGKIFKHAAGVVAGARLAEDAALKSDLGIGTDDDGRACGASGDEFGFGDGEALDQVVGGFTGVGRFVDGGREDGEGESSAVEDFGAADGGGGENEFHEVPEFLEGKNTIARTRQGPVLWSSRGSGTASQLSVG